VPSTNFLLTSHHPDYDEVVPDYVLMEDSYKGQRAIKAKGFTYLRPTEGMILDGAEQNIESIGYSKYLTYLERAKYPDYVERAVGTLVGVLNREDATIMLPSGMEGIRENATRRGESLLQLLRKIHEHQLRFGRIALLGDALKDRPTPIFVDYRADSLINWDDDPVDTLAPRELRMAILDESRPELRALTWTDMNRGRALLLTDDTDPNLEFPTNREEGEVPSESRTYRTYTEDENGKSPVIEPRLAGRPLPFIPLTVIGATDLALAPGTIPLLGLANQCLAIYRGEADFRHGLHQQGQDTLVVIGEEGSAEDPDEATADKETRVGTGAKISVPLGGDAKFIGVNPAGLAEQRASIADDKKEAQEEGARLLTPQAATAESGEALRIRISASTATLQGIAKTAAKGLEAALKQMAVWMGLNPDEVRVEPNLNFSEVRPEPTALGAMMDAKSKGAPLSLESVHRFAREGDLTRMTYEEELAAIAAETPLIEPDPDPAAPGSEDPNPAE
jgi:hypothetical protein